jgi:hypothetical protein
MFKVEFKQQIVQKQQKEFIGNDRLLFVVVNQLKSAFCFIHPGPTC